MASYNEAIAVSAIAFLSEKMQFEFYVIRGRFVRFIFDQPAWVGGSRSVGRSVGRFNQL